MNLEKIPLKTVRQFFIQDVVLADHEAAFMPETPQVAKKVEDFCYAKVGFRTGIRTGGPVSPLLFIHLKCSNVGHRDAGRRRERATRVSAHPGEASGPPEGELVTFASSASVLASSRKRSFRVSTGGLQWRLRHLQHFSLQPEICGQSGQPQRHRSLSQEAGEKGRHQRSAQMRRRG